MRYQNFDILRLFLAGEVFIDHARFVNAPQIQWNIFVEPVPAFLAISGFLVLKSYGDSSSPLEFFGKRALRILPALAASLLLCGLLFGPGAIFNSVLVWVTGGLYAWPQFGNGPLWSLLWEEIAYASLVILWLAGAYKRPVYIVALLIAAVGIVWLNDDLDPHYRTILLLPVSFFIGNLMYLYRDELSLVDPFVPILAILVMLEWRQLPDAWLMGGASNVLVSSVVIVWVGMAGRRLLPWKISDLSYGLYIYHYPVVVFLHDKLKIASFPAMLIVTTLVLIPLTLASWYFVERPALRLKRKLKSLSGRSATVQDMNPTKTVEIAA